MPRIDKGTITSLFERMSQLHVVVVGDLILDNYLFGDVERISPEAPVPVVTIHKRESRLGGAANVALNCRALGAKVTLASVIGNDKEGDVLLDYANKAGINTALVQRSGHRATTNKTRVISRSQHMLRLDEELAEDLYTEEEHPFIDAVLKFLQIEKPDVLIFEDYDKGVLKENVIQRISAHCKELGITTTVDPKKKNFLSYKNVTLFKPNLKEVREALNISVDPVKEILDKVHASLKNELNHQISFITLSEKGVYYSNGSSAIIPSHLRNIADVSGAGDTVIATASMVYALTKDVALMAEISNIAGGLVCEESGVVPIDKTKLQEESITLLTSG
jgi:D-glycero-beta-D-manno-heptose-7-phosphate kinase